ncbi:carbohydrate ABC transporter permease [Cohnella sp. LGH]|uniref:carbohydrate ABC transporter permease n=1 Tax=unclassified Cohnella TaxID=2636738 RepID=UPI001ADC1317|nr:carbohydrate ABC transporter permease [Cohnella sp. LGH]QTH41953.1 carbohydrate ABC transporter permease [Cohnella sp. LGH]
MNYTSFGGRLFTAFNYVFLISLGLLCILPLVHVGALSFSSSTAAGAGIVKLWPIEFTWKSYEFVLRKKEFLHSMEISLQRVLLGVAVNMLLTVMLGYALSKESRVFTGRTWYAWFFVLTIFVNGGFIPWYLVIKEAGLLNSLGALILPGAVPVFNVVLLLNFFRSLPKELEESAFMDGAGHWKILWRIFLPLSLPAIATIGLFTIVGHWNAWFDGLILMNSPDKYPLQSYLQTVVINHDLALINSTDITMLAEVSDRTLKAAQTLLGALPILMVYPFLQKYFVKGMVLGSVKE